jgi:hypothetical protein
MNISKVKKPTRYLQSPERLKKRVKDKDSFLDVLGTIEPGLKEEVLMQYNRLKEIK